MKERTETLDLATMNPLEPLGEVVSVEGGRSQTEFTEE